jgi:hypothetical protein
MGAQNCQELYSRPGTPIATSALPEPIRPATFLRNFVWAMCIVRLSGTRVLTLHRWIDDKQRIRQKSQHERRSSDASKAHAAAGIAELTTVGTMLFSRWGHQLEKVAEGCDDASL